MRHFQRLPALVLLISALLFMTVSAGMARNAQAGDSLLWRIDGPTPSYLFGTIHVPDDRVLKLPAVVEKALNESQVIQTEIPMDPATQVSMAPRLMLPGDQTLVQVLPADLYKRLDQVFSEKKIPLFAMAKFKVWAITVQVIMLDHIMEFATKQPLDMVIFSRGQQAGKEVGGLETVDEQIQVFDSLTQDEQIRSLKQTLDLVDQYKKKGVDAIDQLIQAYLSGDEAKLYSSMMETYDPKNELDKKMLKRLFTDRNSRMSDRILERVRKPGAKSHFFAIGAGHLVGKGSIVELLRKKGLKVTRVKR